MLQGKHGCHASELGILQKCSNGRHHFKTIRLSGVSRTARLRGRVGIRAASMIRLEPHETQFMRKGHQGRAVALCMANLRDSDSMYAEYKVKADSMTMHRISPESHYVQNKSRTSQHEASILVIGKAHQKLGI